MTVLKFRITFVKHIFLNFAQKNLKMPKNVFFGASLWTVHQKLKKLKFQDEKIKVLENLTGIISIYLTLNLEGIFFHFLA